MFYPKINSLFKRDPETKKLIIGDFACPEFDNIKHWRLDEKIDGTNIRITYHAASWVSPAKLEFGGRTDNALLPAPLVKHLQDTFTIPLMEAAFPESNFVVLFGEGYGGKIQAGSYYRKDQAFILFDAFVSGWWLERDSIVEIAEKLKIKVTPEIVLNPNLPMDYTPWTINAIVNFVISKPNSIQARENHVMEGIMARPVRQMLFRHGEPIVFKLKCKDFE